MAYPICDMCASSGVLCNGCQKKLESGEITDLDITVSHLLLKEGIDSYRRLRETDNGVFIFADREIVPKIIGYSGKTVKEFSKKLGKRVIVIEEDAELRERIEAVVRPSRVLAVNTVYKSDGSESLKLVLSEPLRDPGLLALAGEIAGREIEVD